MQITLHQAEQVMTSFMGTRQYFPTRRHSNFTLSFQPHECSGISEIVCACDYFNHDDLRKVWEISQEIDSTANRAKKLLLTKRLNNVNDTKLWVESYQNHHLTYGDWSHDTPVVYNPKVFEDIRNCTSLKELMSIIAKNKIININPPLKNST